MYLKYCGLVIRNCKEIRNLLNICKQINFYAYVKHSMETIIMAAISAPTEELICKLHSDEAMF